MRFTALGLEVYKGTFQLYMDGTTNIFGQDGGTGGVKVTAAGVVLGTGAALLVGATAGDVYFPSSRGTPTGVPSLGSSVGVSCRYDTVNNKHCCYNGGWKCSAAYT